MELSNTLLIGPFDSETCELFRISGRAAKPIVSIKADGTVVVHKLGGEKEAAEIFYRELQIRGKTLFARIAELEAEVASLKQTLSN